MQTLAAVLTVVTATATAPQLPGPSLTLLDSIVLEESEENYVSGPLDMAWGPKGSILISDGYANAILEFDTSGRFVRAFGGAGEGPGEFLGIGAVFAGRDLVGAVDMRGAAIKLFDYETGESIGQVRLRPTMQPSSMTQVGDRMWVSGMDQDSWMTVGTVAMDSLVAIARGEVVGTIAFDRVPAPAPYQENPFMAGALGASMLDIGMTDMISSFAGSSYLLRSSLDGRQTLGAIDLVPRIRRGAPDEQDVGAGADLNPRTFANEISVLRALSRDDANNVLVLHTDLQIEGMQVREIVYYVSTVTADGTQCADTLVPTGAAGQPLVALRGRTLYVVDQTQAGNEVATRVTRYEVEPASCSNAT